MRRWPSQVTPEQRACPEAPRPATADRRRARTDRGGAWRGGLSAESEARRCGDDFCASSSAGRCPALVSCLRCLPVCRSACAETLSLCVCVCGQDIHVYAYMGTICLSVCPSVCVRNTCSHRRGCEGAWVGVVLVRPPRIPWSAPRFSSRCMLCGICGVSCPVARLLRELPCLAVAVGRRFQTASSKLLVDLGTLHGPEGHE